MRPRSATYRQLIAAPARQIDAACTIVLLGRPLDDPAPSVTVSRPQARISHPAHLADGVTAVPRRWWVLGQAQLDSETWGLAPSDGAQQMGVWTAPSVTSASDGTVSPPLVLTLTWPRSRAITAVTVAGDAAWGQGPRDWTATLRLSGTTVGSVTVTDADVPRHTATVSPAVEADELEVAITRWSHGGQVLRVTEASPVISVELGRGDLVGLTAVDECESESGRPSADEVVVRVLARSLPAGVAEALRRPGRRIIPSAGPLGAERQPLPLVLSTRATVDQRRGIVEVEGQDVMGWLAELQHPGVEPAQGRTAKQLAEAVLAPVPPEWWWVSPALASITLPWSALPAGSVRDLLVRIAQLADAELDTDRAGLLRLQPRVTPSAWEQITQSRIVKAEVREASERAPTVVRVVGATLALGSTEQLAQVQVTVPVGSSEWTVSWRDPARERSVAVTGDASLDAVLADEPTRVRVRVTSASGGTATIAVSGRRLSETGRIAAEARDDAAIAEAGERVRQIDEPLVQSAAHAQSLAEAILAREGAGVRRLVLQWRGDPALEPGDGIECLSGRWVVERIETEIAGGLTQRVTARWVEAAP